MYKQIVLAYDGTLEGRRALREGVLLALRNRSKIHLLAVVAENPSVKVAEGIQPGAADRHQTNYGSILQEAVNGLASHGVPVTAKLAQGDPPQVIAGYAAKVRADLVVVGHRKLNLLQRWWSGSSGAYLSDHLKCSLLIARNVIDQEEFLREIDAWRVSEAAHQP